MMVTPRALPLLGFILWLSSTPLFSQSSWVELIGRLAADGHSRQELEVLFGDTEFDPDPVRSKLRSRFEAKFQATRIRGIQEGLQELGFDPGPTDGIAGPQTRRAITAFQKKHGMPRDGRPTFSVLEEIGYQLHPERPRKKRTPPGQSVYPYALKPERLTEAQQFWQQNRSILEEIEQEYGIPPEIGVAILAIETRVGNYLGKKKAVVTLASLASAHEWSLIEPLFSDYTLTRQRLSWLQANARSVSEWAYRELSALLEYADRANLEVGEIPGSPYGAIGISQFMPTSALRFGVDGNQDGVVNLFEVEDAVRSMANYLKENGWRNGLKSRSAQRRVIYRYNHSRIYVNTVLAVADALAAD